MSKPKHLWCWSFQRGAAAWNGWGGYARPENRRPLDDREAETGAEYIRTDLARADTEAAVRRALEAAAKGVEALGYFGPSESGFTVATEIRALAADPVALAKIVEGKE